MKVRRSWQVWASVALVGWVEWWAAYVVWSVAGDPRLLLCGLPGIGLAGLAIWGLERETRR